MSTRGVLLAAVLVVAFAWNSAAAQQTARFAATAPGESIANLDTLKSELKQYHACTCGCYAKDLDLQADRAITFLRRRAAHRKAGEKLALVLDIDETTLSNYAEMAQEDFAYNAKAFAAWVSEANAPAIPGTLRICKEARRLGVSVFFLTGRPDTQREPTAQNLRAQGFEDWQDLILRRPAQTKMTALAYKSEERAKIAAEGYRIVLNVGDQWSDLRGSAEAEYSVKYPDPYYFIQ